MSARSTADACASFNGATHTNKPPRLALSIGDACEALGVSWGFWRSNVEPEIKVCRVGRRKLVAVSELQGWLDRHGESVEAYR